MHRRPDGTFIAERALRGRSGNQESGQGRKASDTPGRGAGDRKWRGWSPFRVTRQVAQGEDDDERLVLMTVAMYLNSLGVQLEEGFEGFPVP